MLEIKPRTSHILSSAVSLLLFCLFAYLFSWLVCYYCFYDAFMISLELKAISVPQPAKFRDLGLFPMMYFLKLVLVVVVVVGVVCVCKGR